MTIIGLVGPAGSGKDTTAQMLRTILDEAAEHLGFQTHNLHELRFADELKAWVGALFDWGHDRTHGDLKEAEDPRYDRTESINMMRQRDARLLEEYMDFTHDFNRRGRIPDFLDELHARGYYGPDFVTSRFAQQHLGTQGVRVIWTEAWVALTIRKCQMFDPRDIIVIPDVRFPNEAQGIIDAGGVLWRCTRDQELSRYDEPSAQHASETSHIGIQADYLIDNTGTLEDLKPQVKKAFIELLSLRHPETGRYNRDQFEDEYTPYEHVTRLQTGDILDSMCEDPTVDAPVPPELEDQ